MLRSAICRYDHFNTDWYRNAGLALGIVPGVSADVHASYRKNWEWCSIFEVLSARGMLTQGRSGIGFAVGTEPLASAMANRGAQVLATDLHVDQSNERWSETGQHAASLEALWHRDLIDEHRFRKKVSFQPADMKHLDDFEDGSFDFTWSSCALEHIGDLQDGLDFIVKAMRLLKPGGVAAHTTEYNLSSNDATVPHGDCIYRRQDIEQLDYLLRPHKCGLEPIDYDAGTHSFDLDYDAPPYSTTQSRHLKLLLHGYVCTSMLLVVRKA